MRLLSTLAFAAISMVAPAVAQSSQVIQHILAGEWDKAEILVQNAQATKAEILFFKAARAKTSGDLKRAQKLFSAVLVETPGNVIARSELAHTYALLGRYRMAEKTYTDLQQIDTDPMRRAAYRREIARIRKHKKFNISGYITILPSTNLNRGSKQTIFSNLIGDFSIDETSQAISGLGVKGGLSGNYRLKENREMRSSLIWGLDVALYESSSFNSYSGRVGYLHETAISPKTRISLSPTVSYTKKNDGTDFRAYRLAFSGKHQLTRKEHLSFSISSEYQDYLTATEKTGLVSNLGVGYTHQFSSTSAFSTNATFTISNPEARHTAYNGIRLSAVYSKSWDGGLVTTFELEGGFRNYKADFPLTDSARSDRFLGTHVTLQNNKYNFSGFVPGVKCSYIINKSNVSFYDYDVFECGLRISRGF